MGSLKKQLNCFVPAVAIINYKEESVSDGEKEREAGAAIEKEKENKNFTGQIYLKLC